MAKVPTSHDGRPFFETTAGIRHHTKAQCDGHPCPFHGPSLHGMVEERMILRTDWGVPFIERACRHGIGHPDPDSIAWLDRNGHDGFGVHGCDGCCRKLDVPGGPSGPTSHEGDPPGTSHNPTPSSATDERA